MLAYPLCILESVGAEVVFSLPTYEIKNSFWYEWVCVFNNNMQPSATATLQFYGFHSTVDLSTWFVLFFSSDWQTADSASMANIQWIQSIQLQTGTIFSNKIDILHWMCEKRTLWMSFQFNCSTSFFCLIDLLNAFFKRSTDFGYLVDMQRNPLKCECVLFYHFFLSFGLKQYSVF